jgi:hypothetical protein
MGVPFDSDDEEEEEPRPSLAQVRRLTIQWADCLDAVSYIFFFKASPADRLAWALARCA